MALMSIISYQITSHLINMKWWGKLGNSLFFTMLLVVYLDALESIQLSE